MYPFVQRRDPSKGRVTNVPCRACGADVHLDPAKMRLKATCAELVCPTCGVRIEVRRSDGYADTDGGVAWLFESYASEAPDEEPETRPRKRRLVPWPH